MDSYYMYKDYNESVSTQMHSGYIVPKDSEWIFGWRANVGCGL